LKPTPSSAGLLRSSTFARAAGISNQQISRRGYVFESKRDHAQVNIDTAIRADQKAFFQETGKLPENQNVTGAGVNVDAMMSPMAGMCCGAYCSILLIFTLL
jgi:cysteine desulfurase